MFRAAMSCLRVIDSHIVPDLRICLVLNVNASRKQRLIYGSKRARIVFSVLFLIPLGINLYIVFTARNSIYGQAGDLPECDFALVLGTDATRSDGSPNSHFLSRTETAAKAYFAGKVKHLLISGNKDNRGFNEVLGMKNQILAQHVPEDAILLDFDGVRTWESFRRARQIFHVQKVIVITDSFHAPRALFLCRHFG